MTSGASASLDWLWKAALTEKTNSSSNNNRRQTIVAQSTIRSDNPKGPERI